MNKTLDELRVKIDQLDEELLNIVSRRFKIVEQIGRLKKMNKIKPLDEKRREDVLNKWKKYAKKDGVSEELAKKIYLLLHDYSLKIESINK